ncbi:DUF1573 domain-containing protein, partial [Bacteroidota bacterium]
EIIEDNKKSPEISFDKLVHDYGTIEKGADGMCEFVFTNTGKEPLILENVRSSCGCTVPSWPKEPVKKKKTGTIKVKYNTNRVGTISKSVTVYSNAKNSPIKLKIIGKVVDNKTTTTTITSPVLEEKKISTLPRIDDK